MVPTYQLKKPLVVFISCRIHIDRECINSYTIPIGTLFFKVENGDFKNPDFKTYGQQKHTLKQKTIIDLIDNFIKIKSVKNTYKLTLQ